MKAPKAVKSLIIIIGIPALLFILGFFLSSVQFYRQEISFLSLTKNHSTNDITSSPAGNLLAGNKISGKFVAYDDYLGIVSVRFDTFYRINDDWLVFRIKQLGDSKWYYENYYKVDQFQSHELFPFGFPIIKNSAGKTYVFEIESTTGTSDDSVALDKTYPVFISIYKYPRKVVFSGFGPLQKFLPEKLASFRNENIGRTIQANKTIRFIFKKFFNIVINTQIPVLGFFYFLPLIIYLFWLVIYRRPKTKKSYMLAILFLLTFIEIIIIAESIDFIVLEIFLMWIWAVWYYKLKNLDIFVLAFILLGLCPLFLLMNLNDISEKIGAWSFLFFVIAIFQLAIEQKFHHGRRVSILSVLRKIPKDFHDR